MPQRCEAFLSVKHLQFRDYSTSRSHPADATHRGSLLPSLPRVTLCRLKMLHSVAYQPERVS